MGAAEYPAFCSWAVICLYVLLALLVDSLDRWSRPRHQFIYASLICDERMKYRFQYFTAGFFLVGPFRAFCASNVIASTLNHDHVRDRY
jgi:hypothetical protein